MLTVAQSPSKPSVSLLRRSSRTRFDWRGCYLSGNDPHWTHFDGQDCWSYSQQPAAGQHSTWSGSCSNRLASGPGKVIITLSTGQLGSVVTGTMVNGVLQGHALQDGYMPNGLHIIWEGELVNGHPDGPRRVLVYNVNRLAFQFSGNFSDGKESGQGRGITYNADGSVKQDFNGIWAEGKPATPNTLPDVGPGIVASLTKEPSADSARPPVGNSDTGTQPADGSTVTHLSDGSTVIHLSNGAVVTKGPPRPIVGGAAPAPDTHRQPTGEEVLKGLPMPNEHDSPCEAVGKVGFMVGKLRAAGFSPVQADDIIHRKLVSLGALAPSREIRDARNSSFEGALEMGADLSTTILTTMVYVTSSSPEQARFLAYHRCRGGGAK